MIKFLRELFAPYPKIVFVNVNAVDIKWLQLVLGNRYQVVGINVAPGVPHVSSYVVVI